MASTEGFANSETTSGTLGKLPQETIGRHLHSVVSHGAIYAAGLVATRMLSLVAIPIYTRYLKPAEYGTIAVVDMLLAVIWIISRGGLSSAMVRYHHRASSTEERRACWWTGVLLTLLSCCLAAAICFMPAIAFADYLLTGVTDPTPAIVMLLTTMCMTAVEQQFVTTFRAQKWSFLVTVMQFFRSAVNVAANIWLLANGWGVTGIFIGNLVSVVLSLMVCLPVFCNTMGRPIVKWTHARTLFGFSWPLVLVGLMSVVLHQGDRLLLKLIGDASSVGLYSLGYQVVFFASTLLVIPFNSIWTVVQCEADREGEANSVFPIVYMYLAFVAMLLMAGVAMFASPIIAVLGGADYADASKIVPIICIGYYFFAINQVVTAPVLLRSRTALLIPAVALGALSNLIINCALIPRLGGVGAAWATAVSLLLTYLTNLYIGRRLVDYGFRALPVLGIGLMGCAIWVLTRQIGDMYGIVYEQMLATLLLLCLSGAVVWRLVPLYGLGRNRAQPEMAAGFSRWTRWLGR